MSLSWADRLARLAQQIDNAGVIESAALPPGGGTHPDLAAHVTLGLAGTHAHPYSSDVHAHAGVYEPSGAVAAHEADATSVHGIASTSALVVTTDPRLSDARTPLTHAHLDADIPAGIARDAEVTAAITTHEAAVNPHATYATDADLAAHAGAVDPHTGYATDADLTAHAATPHGGSGTWTAVIKTADESKNNLATVADDALLKFTTVANTNYVIRLRAFFLTNATADLKYRLVHGGTTTRVRRSIVRTSTGDVAAHVTTGTAFDAADVVLSTTGLNPTLYEEVILQVGASGGVLKLQWAQVTSNAGPTTCLEGSYLEYALT